METTATASTAVSAKVQLVTKKYSDELLRKFAELGSDERQEKKDLHVAKRLKKSPVMREDGHCESPCNGSTALVERRSLLPRAATQRSALLRQLGIGRTQLRARYIRNKSLMGTIVKTWRRTIEGTSTVFIEKHYNRHKRLNQLSILFDVIP